jgi:hypothetical protein
MNIPFDRDRRVVSGTQRFIVDTRDLTNNFEKNSNQSLTSLTLNFVFFAKFLKNS